MKNRLYTLLVVVMLLLAGIQIGCDDWTADDEAFAKDLAMSWLQSKGMRPPVNADGTPNAGGIADLAVASVIGSGDDEVDAVLGIYGSVSGVISGDKAMDEARASGNAEAMDKVIASRPHDYTYRSSRAALAVAQGDMNTYQQQTAEFTRLAAERKVPETQQARRIIADYERIPVPDTGAQCTAKYSELSKAYDALYKATGDGKWSDLAWAAAGQMAACE